MDARSGSRTLEEVVFFFFLRYTMAVMIPPKAPKTTKTTIRTTITLVFGGSLFGVAVTVLALSVAPLVVSTLSVVVISR